MKLLLVADREDLKRELTFHFHPIGGEVIHYMNPLKAMDNIDEIDPEAVIFSGLDYPRHWKPFLTLLRQDKSRGESIFILLRGKDFSVQEAAKAVHLEVNGIILESEAAERVCRRIEDILVRYDLINDGRLNKRYLPGDYDRLDFVMTHPETLQVVTGTVGDMSLTGARFTPDDPGLTADISRGTEVPACSLQAGEDIISVVCRVVRNDTYLGLQFISISEAGTALLKEYLDTHVERELDSRIRGSGGEG